MIRVILSHEHLLTCSMCSPFSLKHVNTSSQSLSRRRHGIAAWPWTNLTAISPPENKVRLKQEAQDTPKSTCRTSKPVLGERQRSALCSTLSSGNLGVNHGGACSCIPKALQGISGLEDRIFVAHFSPTRSKNALELKNHITYISNTRYYDIIKIYM